MEKYNYYSAVLQDVKDYLNENVDAYIDNKYKEKLADDMLVSDTITGNASGSYTFSTWKAEENLCHNWDLLIEALESFGLDISEFSKGPESLDVMIRCYLLDHCLGIAVKEWNENHIEDYDNEFEDSEE